VREPSCAGTTHARTKTGFRLQASGFRKSACRAAAFRRAGLGVGAIVADGCVRADRRESAVDPLRIHNGAMAASTITISIKNVPVDIARRLKTRAERNHRSLQGELMAILDEASRELTMEDLAAVASRLGLRTPAESQKFVRDDRDGRRR